LEGEKMESLREGFEEERELNSVFYMIHSQDFIFLNEVLTFVYILWRNLKLKINGRFQGEKL
jgi:hypothetical protein